MKWISDLWASKKFRVMLGGVLVNIVNSQLQFLPPDVIQWVDLLIMTYIGGQSAVDTAKAIGDGKAKAAEIVAAKDAK